MVGVQFLDGERRIRGIRGVEGTSVGVGAPLPQRQKDSEGGEEKEGVARRKDIGGRRTKQQTHTIVRYNPYSSPTLTIAVPLLLLSHFSRHCLLHCLCWFTFISFALATFAGRPWKTPWRGRKGNVVGAKAPLPVEPLIDTVVPEEMQTSWRRSFAKSASSLSREDGSSCITSNADGVFMWKTAAFPPQST